MRRVPDALRDATAAVNGQTIRPTQVPRLDAELFSQAPRNGCVSDAFRGLLLALALARDPRRQPKAPPQPVRGHLFFHNLQNLWACVNPACNHVPRPPANEGEPPLPVGALHPRHRITCDCGSRVLDLIVCEVCGDVFLGGYRARTPVGQQVVEILTTDQPDLDNMPDRVDLQKRAATYAIFWPVDEDLPRREQEYTAGGIDRFWQRARLSTATGVLRRTAGQSSRGRSPGGSTGSNETTKARPRHFPVRCPQCGTDYRRRSTFPRRCAIT